MKSSVSHVSLSFFVEPSDASQSEGKDGTQAKLSKELLSPWLDKISSKYCEHESKVSDTSYQGPWLRKGFDSEGGDEEP